MRTTHRFNVQAAAAVGVALAFTLAGAGAANAGPGGGAAIPLTNGQETTGANTGASGFFSYTVDGDQFCYTLTASRLSVPAAAAHIHVAARKVAGPIVIPLTVGAGTDWTVEACATADPALLQAVAANPHDYYANVHTPTFPGGEIRGQLK